MRSMALWGIQLCGRRVVCGLCRASILAGLALMQGGNAVSQTALHVVAAGPCPLFCPVPFTCLSPLSPGG
ncbi:hypothetical protein KZ770_26320 [Escherichia coli]|nr:hypothetical protein [Escherichia coli]